MSINSFNSLLRLCITAMYSDEWIKTIEYIAGYSLTEEAQVILKDIVMLIMETDYFKPDTKAFLANKSSKYFNSKDSNKCAVNSHTSRSRINYDLAKLRGILGEDALDIIIKQHNTDISRYREKIQELLKKHKDKSLLDGFSLKLPKGRDVVTSISDEDYEILKEIAKYGSKKGKELMEFNLTPEIIGYLIYLDQFKDRLKGSEMEKYNELAAWLK